MASRSIGGVSHSAATRIDPELGMDNLCEIKHHMLTRNARADDIDRRLKPNSGARDALETIIRVSTHGEIGAEKFVKLRSDPLHFWVKNGLKLTFLPKNRIFGRNRL